MVHAKSRVVVVVLAPYPPLVQDAIVGRAEGVVERDDQGQEPGDGGEDLVDDDGVLAMLVSLGERVDCKSDARNSLAN